MADENKILDELLVDWKERHDQGQDVAPEELCAAFPELAPSLQDRIVRMMAMQMFMEMGKDLPGQPTPPAEEAGETHFPEVLSPPRQPGELGHLGPYRVLRKLGSGGMGLVFEAEDPKLERKVALKVLRPDLVANHEAHQRFLREARAMAALSHDHIIPIYQVGEERDVPFLAMPLLQGELLAERLRREQKLPAAEVVQIGEQIAEGLAAAHNSGLLHRDIKPGNLWLETLSGARGAGAFPYRVKILDFGLTRPLDPDVVATRAGAIVGTPAYMAPEQAEGQTIDARADLFSLGCVLYQLCTGELPFKGDSIVAVLRNVAVQEPVPPNRLNAEVPAALSSLILRLLAKRPEERPATAREVAAALRALENAATASLAPAPPQPPTVACPRPRRFAHRTAWTAAGLGVLGLAALAVWLLRPRNEPAPAPALAPLNGSIDIVIWEADNPRRRDLSLSDPAALPLKATDEIGVKVKMNRPAYLYVLWIDTQGKVEPVYPWTPGHWEERPAVEQPINELRRPEASDKFYPMQQGPPGMETLLLLARETPLPPEVDLRAELGPLPPQREQDMRATVWFENGDVVRNEAGRAPRFDAKQLNDPVLQTQQRIREKLQPLFSYTRAVSFANQGK